MVFPPAALARSRVGIGNRSAGARRAHEEKLFHLALPRRSRAREGEFFLRADHRCEAGVGVLWIKGFAAAQLIAKLRAQRAFLKFPRLTEVCGGTPLMNRSGIVCLLALLAIPSNASAQSCDGKSGSRANPRFWWTRDQSRSRVNRLSRFGSALRRGCLSTWAAAPSFASARPKQSLATCRWSP